MRNAELDLNVAYRVLVRSTLREMRRLEEPQWRKGMHSWVRVVMGTWG